MSRRTSWRTAGLAAAIALAAGAAVAQEKELVFGLHCDRTGATQTVGVFLCPGYHDYIALAATSVLILFLESFKQFPPRQKPGSFSLDQALQKMNDVASGAGH